MRPAIALFLGFCTLYGQTPSQPPPSAPQLTVEDFKKRIASYPADEQVYELWRFWIVGQPADVQKLFDQESTKASGLALYRKQLQSEGDRSGEFDLKLQIIDKEGERWEIERWNRVLTSNSARINRRQSRAPSGVCGSRVCRFFLDRQACW